MPRIEVKLDSLPKGVPHRLECDGTGIVVIRTESGIHAYHDVCPHASWRLSDGEIVGGILECPGHGWQFELATGRCQSVPAYCLKPVSVAVAILEKTVRFEWCEQKEIAVGTRSRHGEALV